MLFKRSSRCAKLKVGPNGLWIIVQFLSQNDSTPATERVISVQNIS